MKLNEASRWHDKKWNRDVTGWDKTRQGKTRQGRLHCNKTELNKIRQTRGFTKHIRMEVGNLLTRYGRCSRRRWNWWIRTPVCSSPPIGASRWSLQHQWTLDDYQYRKTSTSLSKNVYMIASVQSLHFTVMLGKKQCRSKRECGYVPIVAKAVHLLS